MKKYLALLLAAMMMLSCLAGCGVDNNADPNAGNQGQTENNGEQNNNETEGPPLVPMAVSLLRIRPITVSIPAR